MGRAPSPSRGTRLRTLHPPRTGGVRCAVARTGPRPLTIHMATYVLEILDGDRAGETLPVADRTLRIGRSKGSVSALSACHSDRTNGLYALTTLKAISQLMITPAKII